MNIFAITVVHGTEFVLAFSWSVIAIMSFFSYRNGPCADLLGPTKIYTIMVSTLWVVLYIVSITDVFSLYVFGSPSALHAVGNGLLIVTVINFALFIYSTDKAIRSCGVV